jgi:hypothetical protein
VSRELGKRFVAPDYHLLNHLTLRLKGETTQIDHVLVSRFGVFVIETKHYNGWIFADSGDRQWTQVLYRVKNRFQNPIRQNYKHVCAVQELLDFLPEGRDSLGRRLYWGRAIQDLHPGGGIHLEWAD